MVFYFYAYPPEVRAVYALRSVNGDDLNKKHLEKYPEFIKKNYAFICIHSNPNQMGKGVEKGDMLAALINELFGLRTAKTLRETFKEYLKKVCYY